MTTATIEPPAETKSRLLEVDPNRFAALEDYRRRVTESLVHFNAANEDAKAKKKIYEAARSAFEREFDRFVANIHGEDLPLFSQSELLDRAQADPIVMKLVDQLLAAGHDVNAILVAGYTPEERQQASEYLDALETAKNVQAVDGREQPAIDIPPFLLPQPLTPIEIADLANRLADEDLAIDAEMIGAWTKAQTAEVMDWLTRCEGIRKAKGEALVMDDLPAAPDWLEAAADGNGADDGEGDTAAADADDQE